MTGRERLYLYDTTLRDGAQTPGVDFSVPEKQLVIDLLDELGIDYVEGGYPGANPTDTELFGRKPTSRARFTAFGMVKRPGISLSNDPGLRALLDAKADAICFVAKAWDYHVRVALETTPEEHLDAMRQSVTAAREAGREVLLDAEHFFDGWKANREHALDVARAAYESGARWVVLCDTNGGTMPEEVEAIVGAVAEIVPGDHLGIHAHNDTEQAVANSLAAVRAGARQIQGTLNGLGERCGNANLTSLIPTLMLKPAYAERFTTGVSEAGLAGLTALARRFDELLNRAPNRQAPYVGASAFATKAGIHASALAKDTRTYEHVPPDKVGNRRRILVSDQSGKSNIMAGLERHVVFTELERLGVSVDKNNPGIASLLDEIKTREAAGYAFEDADASFAVLAWRKLGAVSSFFEVEKYDVTVEHRVNALGKPVTVSVAVVKVNVGGETLISAAEGIGPVNALDLALRKDLGVYQRAIADLELVDYKVRILTGGTEAVTRVLIESADASGARWFTVGVSPNIIDASFEALMDSIMYKLVKDGVKPVAVAAPKAPAT